MAAMVFEGKAIVLTGRFTTSQAEFQQELEAQGAEITNHVSSRTDFLATGTRSGQEKLERAKSLGINLLSEDDARALMRGEQLEVDRVGRLGESSVDELLGQARGLLDRTMCPALWEEIVALLDACLPEQQEVLVNYLEPQLEKWEQPGARVRAMEVFATQALSIGDGDREPVRHALSSLSMQPPSSARFAPDHWMGEMMQGVASPKYRLMRTLDLRYMSAAQKMIHRMLTHPELTGLRALYFHASKLPGKDHVEALVSHDNFASLEHFAPGNVGPFRVKQLTAATQTRFAPKILDLWGYSGEYFSEQEEGVLVALARAPCFQQVDTLVLPSGGGRVTRFAEELIEHELMPQLHTLVWCSFGPRVVSFQRMMPLFERVRELAITLLTYGEHKLSGWKGYLKSDLPANIVTLDVSGLNHDLGTGYHGSIQPMIFSTDKIKARAFRQLCDSALLRHIKHVNLGPLYFDEVVLEVLERRRPDIAVHP